MKRERIANKPRCGSAEMNRDGATARLWGVAVLSACIAAAGGQELSSQTALITPDPQHGMVLFLKRCAACHGRHAWGDGPREIPALAGQHENYLIAQLELFSSGQRPGSEMHGPAMRESIAPPDVNRTQAIHDLTNYLVEAPRNPRSEHGDGEALALGQRVYERMCATCHGEDGAGNETRSPAIGGQHYNYLAAQLKSFTAARQSHPSGLAGLSAEELQAVADYASRLSYLSAAPRR